jgi:hypothetical protein
MAAAVSGFISYAREDRAICERLLVHLRPFENSGLVAFWHDQRNEPGVDWNAELQARLEETRVALLIVTADFFWSDFIRTVELPFIQGRAARGAMRCIPVIAKPVCWEAMEVTGIGIRQAVPKDAKPIADHRPHDRGYVDAVARIIASVRESLKAAP